MNLISFFIFGSLKDSSILYPINLCISERTIKSSLSSILLCCGIYSSNSYFLFIFSMNILIAFSPFLFSKITPETSLFLSLIFSSYFSKISNNWFNKSFSLLSYSLILSENELIEFKYSLFVKFKVSKANKYASLALIISSIIYGFIFWFSIIFFSFSSSFFSFFVFGIVPMLLLLKLNFFLFSSIFEICSSNFAISV